MKYIKINNADNVAIALNPLKAGDILKFGEQSLTLIQDIPQGHKTALVDIMNGDNIIKYGAPIGHAIAPIKAGEHIHVHNIKTNLSGTVTYA